MVLWFLPLAGCVEPFEVDPEIIGTSSLEGTLIVQANITNTNGRQQVFLSRMQQVESDSTVNVPENTLFNPFTPVLIQNGLEPQFESDAIVQVRDDLGTVYAFNEVEPGRYESATTFAADFNRSYQLVVTTSDNEAYVSNTVSVPNVSSIDAIYAERITTDLGQEGMAIFVDSSVPQDGDNLIRYAYEETYKIIAPNWTPVEFEIIRDEIEFVFDPVTGDFIGNLYPDVTTVPRAREERVCFKTDYSAEVILGDLDNVSNNSISRNRVRFLDRNNPVISHRYSILVRQFVTSQTAFNFYENLRNFSSSESLFSQVQPGPLEGNIQNANGEPVLGLFEVTTETSQRLYFNYADFFPGEALPPYFGDGFNCEMLLSPPLGNPERDGPPSPDGRCPQPLVERIKLGLVEYVDVNPSPDICEGPYFVTPTLCGDCTIVGSNVVPDFWEE